MLPERFEWVSGFEPAMLATFDLIMILVSRIVLLIVVVALVSSGCLCKILARF
jgi:hypothetical protein